MYELDVYICYDYVTKIRKLIKQKKTFWAFLSFQKPERVSIGLLGEIRQLQ